jgi:hypothetical protein
MKEGEKNNIHQTEDIKTSILATLRVTKAGRVRRYLIC